MEPAGESIDASPDIKCIAKVEGGESISSSAEEDDAGPPKAAPQAVAVLPRSIEAIEASPEEAEVCEDVLHRKAPSTLQRSPHAIEASCETIEFKPEDPQPKQACPLTFEDVVKNVGENVLAADVEIPPVQVCVRLRPLLAWERSEGHESTSFELRDGLHGMITLKPREGGSETSRLRNFKFDAVFGQERTQQDMWELAHVDSLVARVAAGFHATIFAYGQTGSGKTFTMEGFAYNHHNGSSAPTSSAARPKVNVQATPPEQLGIVPRAVQRLFVHAESLIQQARATSSQEESFCVKASFLQIYKEKIFDLLNPSHTPAQRESSRSDECTGLRMRWDSVRRQFFVENLFEYECATADDVLQHYSTGLQNKHVASTAMNVASSRSHTILVLTLVRRIGATAAPDSNPQAPVPVAREVVSKLALVDLAGSERASASSTGNGERGSARFSEAVNINQSLFVLRKVITALSKRSKNAPASARNSQSTDSHHVPYRESKLTSLLQHSIGGNSFLLMLACLSPSDKHFEENLSTLQYASQAACIKNEPILNVDPKDRLIEHLKAQLAAAHRYILQITGLTELPDEIMQVSGRSRKAGTRASHRLPQYSAYSTGRTPSAPSGSSWRSEFCHKQEQLEAHTTLGPRPSSEASVQIGCDFQASLTIGPQMSISSSTTASTTCSKPFASRGSTPETMPLNTVSESSTNGPLYPVEELLLAAGSSYKPCKAGLGLSDIPGTPPSLANSFQAIGNGTSVAKPPAYALARPSGPPGVVANLERATMQSTCTSRSSESPRSRPPRCRPRPPSLPPAWPTVPSKESLPPIAGTGNSSSSQAAPSSQPDAQSANENLSISMFRSSAWGRKSKRGTSHPTPRSQAKGQDAGLRRQSCPQQHSPAEDSPSKAQDTSAQLQQSQGEDQREGGDETSDSSQSKPTDMAMQSGLWDAVEELRHAKNELEDKLKDARMREDTLKAQLQELRDASAQRSNLAPLASVTTQDVHSSSIDLRIQAENDDLRKKMHVLEERLEAAMSWSDLGPSSPKEKSASREVDFSAMKDTHHHETESLKKEHAELEATYRHEKETLKKEHEELQETLRNENVLLKKERRSLQERLEVFERALELESPRHAQQGQDTHGELNTEDSCNPSKSRLGEKLEQLHSQFVLEVVGLRKEVAGLKKKKWVLRSVLANGGENERKAIENEVAELRRTTGALDVITRSDKTETISLEIDTNMVTTK